MDNEGMPWPSEAQELQWGGRDRETPSETVQGAGKRNRTMEGLVMHVCCASCILDVARKFRVAAVGHLSS